MAPTSETNTKLNLMVFLFFRHSNAISLQFFSWLLFENFVSIYIDYGIMQLSSFQKCLPIPLENEQSCLPVSSLACNNIDTTSTAHIYSEQALAEIPVVVV